MNNPALVPANEIEAGDSVIKKSCCHFWRIGTPHGEHTSGICKCCGEKREFNAGRSKNPKWEATHRLINK